MKILIDNILVNECWPLRQEILRPGRNLHEMEYPGDYSNESLHLGAYVDGVLATVASFYLEQMNNLNTTGHGEYRLRGMATRSKYQSKGIGAQVLRHGIDILRARGATKIWCNARTSAAGYYQKQGFMQLSKEAFDIPGIGPHFVMALEIQAKSNERE